MRPGADRLHRRAPDVGAGRPRRRQRRRRARRPRDADHATARPPTSSQLIDAAGLERQLDAPRRYLEILEPIEIARPRQARRACCPPTRFEMSVEIDLRRRRDRPPDDRPRGRTRAAFRREIAPARTFGFLHEVEPLRATGLARGASLENSIVVDGDARAQSRGPAPPRRVRPPQGAGRAGRPLSAGRAADRPLRGVLRRPRLNNALVRALLARPNAWRRRSRGGRSAPRQADAPLPSVCASDRLV